MLTVLLIKFKAPGAANIVTPDLSKLVKPPVEPEAPAFLSALQKLKHVTTGVPDPLQK
jgi:hypothetical protein